MDDNTVSLIIAIICGLAVLAYTIYIFAYVVPKERREKKKKEEVKNEA